MAWGSDGWGVKAAYSPPPSTDGLIANFNGGDQGVTYTIDGIECWNDNAGKAWSTTQLDNYTIRCELRSGDTWQDGTERDEVSFFTTRYAAGVQLNISETITVQPGPINTGGWCNLHQLHAGTDSPPSPYYLGLNTSDHLQVVRQTPTIPFNLLWTSTNPIVRGVPISIIAQMMMVPAGSGFVRVWVDGAQVVNFTGTIGATGSDYYWKMGVYRGDAAETIIVDHAHWHATTG